MYKTNYTEELIDKFLMEYVINYTSRTLTKD